MKISTETVKDTIHALGAPLVVLVSVVTFNHHVVLKETNNTVWQDVNRANCYNETNDLPEVTGHVSDISLNVAKIW